MEYNDFLRAFTAQTNTVSKCGKEECSTVSVKPLQSSNQNKNKNDNRTPSSYSLEHATEDHKTAMTPGGKIARIEPDATPEGHHCELLEKGQTLDLTNVLPIHVAAFAGNLEGIRTFITEHGADYINNLRIDNDRNVVEFAARGGQLEVLKAFHEEFHIDCDAANERGASPLTIACQEDHVDVVKYLLEEVKADPFRLTTRKRNILSYIVGFCGNLSLATWVHEKFAVVIPPEDNNRILACVCDDMRRDPLKNWELFQYCFEHLGLKIPNGGKYPGVTPESSPDEPHEALMPALHSICAIKEDEQVTTARRKVSEVVGKNPFFPSSSLKKKGIKNIDETQNKNSSQEEEDETQKKINNIILDAVKLVLEKTPNADPNVQSTAGLTAIHAAASCGNLHVMKYLIEERGTKVVTTKIGSPLHHACMSLDPETILYLVKDCKCDPNVIIPRTEVTPIMLLIPQYRQIRGDTSSSSNSGASSSSSSASMNNNNNNNNNYTKDDQFRDCVRILIKHGFQPPAFRVGKDQVAGFLAQKRLSSTSYGIFSTLMNFVTFGRFDVGDANASASSIMTETPAEKRRRLQNMQQQQQNTNKKNNDNYFTEIVDTNTVLNFPLSAVLLAFDYGWPINGVLAPHLSLYNSTSTYSNIGILRFLDELQLSGHPNDSLVCAEYACVGNFPGEKYDAEALQQQQQEGEGSSSASQMQNFIKRMENGDLLDTSSDDDEVFALLDEQARKENSSGRNENHRASTTSRRQNKKNKSSSASSSCQQPKDTIDAIAKFHYISKKYTAREVSYTEYGKVLAFPKQFPLATNSPNDPLAISTLRHIRSKKTILGRFVSEKAPQNASFTLDGIFGGMQSRLSDWVIGVLAKNGFLCNPKRWEK